MTVSNASRVAEFAGSGSTGPYTFDFRIISTSSVLVEKVTDSTGSRSTLVKDTDYTITLVDNGYSGGSITLSTALASGYTLVISGNETVTQERAFRNVGSFAPETHEDAFDKLTIISQEQTDAIDRSLKFAVESSSSSNVPEPESGKILGWTASGKLQNVQPPSAVTNFIDIRDWSDFDATGATDNTSIINAAIAQAKASNTPEVYFPKGIINVDTGITEVITGVKLRGCGIIEANSPYNNNGTVFVMTGTVNPMFSLGVQAAFEGFSVFYPNQTNANFSGGSPVVYQPTFKQAVNNRSQFARFTNIDVIGAYDAIDLGATSYPTADVQIKGCRINAMRRTISINNSPDMIYLDNNIISISAYGNEINGGTTSLRDWIATNGVGIYINGSDSVDGLIISDRNLFFGLNKAVHVASGGLNLSQIAGNLDGCEYGLYADGSATMSHTVFKAKTYCYKNGDAATSSASAIYFAGSGDKQLQIGSSARFEYSQGTHIKLTGTGADRIQADAKYYGTIAAGSGASGDIPAIEVNNANAKVFVGDSDFLNLNGYANAVGVNVTSASHVAIADGANFQAYKTPVNIAASTSHSIGAINTTSTTGTFSIVNAGSGSGIIKSTGNLDKPISGKTGISKVLARYTSGGLVTSGTSILTMVFDSEVFDSNSDYNNSTGVFTAPRTGKYRFDVVVNGVGSTNADIYSIRLVTSNRSYGGTLVIAKQGFVEDKSFSVLADMDAADTAYVTIQRGGGTGTFTPELTDTTLLPTLSIEYIGA